MPDLSANLVIDFTTNNIALRLIDEFDSYEEGDLLRLFGRPQTAPVRTYSGQPPRPHAPDYTVAPPLDLCSPATSVLTSEICVIDFDQSFTTTASPPPERPGIPANYLAPEVAAGRRPLSPASDLWALGCAIFRMRSGDDLFFDYDTDCPADALRQIVKAMGALPEEWGQTRFDEEGFAVEGKEGEPFWSLEEMRPLEDRVQAIVNEPPSLFINEALDAAVEEPEAAMFDDDAALRVPYADALSSMLWRPTAVCVDGDYFARYSDETVDMLKAFPRISGSEAALLVDLLSKIFTYDPETRIGVEELVAHPWFTAVG